jgi:hypothetical protein
MSQVSLETGIMALRDLAIEPLWPAWEQGMQPPRSVQQLSRDELEGIVSGLQTALFAEADGKDRVTWQLEKILNAADVYGLVVDLLDRHGLVPRP